MHSPHTTIRFIFFLTLLTLCGFALVPGKTLLAAKLATPPSTAPASSRPADDSLFMAQYQQMLRPWSARLFPVAAPAAFVGYTITRESSPVIYVDCSQGQSAAYVAYKVTNTSGANVADLWAELAISGDIMLNEDGIYHVGPLANGASTVIYFYVKINNCDDKPSTNLTVNLYTAPPPFGVAAHTTTFAYTVTDDIKAVANKLDAAFVTPAPPTIGGLVTITGTGFTGNIGNDAIFAPTPASLPTWLADTFKLVDVTIKFYNSPSNIMSCNFAGAPTATFNDTLFIQNMSPILNGNTACYKVEYVFVIQQAYAAPKGQWH